MAWLGVDFKDQVVVVTGGASGIGEEVGAAFAKLGAKVFLLDASQEALEKAKLRNPLVTGTFTVDVTREDQIQKSFSTLKRLDVLVNAAGITGITNTVAEKVPTDNFRKVLDINLTGTFLTCKIALGLFMTKQKSGRIINIASIAGKEGNAGMCAYSASKAGVIGLTKSLGKEYATSGNITINALAPAVIRTPMVAAMPKEQVKYMTDKIPMQRTGDLSEIAAMCVFMASAKASFTTGFCWDLSGGRAVY